MIAALLLVLCVAAYRVVTGLLIHSGSTWLSNFTPLAALALCCAAYLPRRFKFVLPLSILFLSDLILNLSYRVPILAPEVCCRYFALVLVVCLGNALRGRASLATLLPASLASSLLFYLITNAFSWLTDPGYAKSLAGFFQALTIGLPQYGATPSWMFFRNSILSDLVFTITFVLCMRNQSAPRQSVVIARVA